MYQYDDIEKAGYNIVPCVNFNPNPLHFERVNGSRNEQYISEDFMSFDTETSTNYYLLLDKAKADLDTLNEKRISKGLMPKKLTIDKDKIACWVYQWCFMYQNQLVYGRTIKEFCEALTKIYDVNELYYKQETIIQVKKNKYGEEEEITKDIISYKKLIIYVHNLSYDYTYIKDWINEHFDVAHEVLAIKEHNLITYRIGGIEFRCSHKLSMKSLEKWGADMNIIHKKLTGTVDYKQIHTQQEQLTYEDWRYMFYDVIALKECVDAQFSFHKDTIATVPLTNTGYVRRDNKQAFRDLDKSKRNKIKRSFPDIDQYRILKNAFSGGLTHGNRFYAGTTVSVDNGMVCIDGRATGKKATCIKHRDFASHYPSQIMYYKSFPVSNWSLYYTHSERNPMPIKELLDLTKQYCVICDITLQGHIRLKDICTALPIAQYCKFVHKNTIQHNEDLCKVDNGRILTTKGIYTVSMTDIDLNIFFKYYDVDYVTINTVYISVRGACAEHIRNTTHKYFKDKSEIKERKKHENLEAEYKIAKGMLNSVYGCMATNPIRDSYYETDEGEWCCDFMSDKTIEDTLEKQKTDVTPNNFAWGVYVTALARAELIEYYELVGDENFLYADTDSIFYISTPEIEERIEKRNEKFRKECDKRELYVEVCGKRSYYNQFEDEKEFITKFRFLHAKCYAYECDNELHTTIAGVKEFGRNGNTRVNELGSIDELEDSKVFKDCGGNGKMYIHRKPSIVYFDKDWNITDKEHAVYSQECASGCIITDTEKTLSDGIIDEYLGHLAENEDIEL